MGHATPPQAPAPHAHSKRNRKSRLSSPVKLSCRAHRTLRSRPSNSSQIRHATPSPRCVPYSGYCAQTRQPPTCPCPPSAMYPPSWSRAAAPGYPSLSPESPAPWRAPCRRVPSWRRTEPCRRRSPTRSSTPPARQPPSPFTGVRTVCTCGCRTTRFLLFPLSRPQPRISTPAARYPVAVTVCAA